MSENHKVAERCDGDPGNSKGDGENMIERKSWKLAEWNETYRREMNIHDDLSKMEKDDIRKAIEWLRENNYPKPEDCPKGKCFLLRPGCSLGVCVFAIKMCGDF